MENPNDTINNDIQENIKDIKTIRKDKASIILLIIGSIVMVLAFICANIFLSCIINYYNASSNPLGTAISLIVIITYFGVPGIILSAISSILNVIAFIISKQRKKLKLIFMILALITFVYSLILILLV